MLLLNSKDIEYCAYIDETISKEVRHDGIFYRGFFFLKIQCFSKDKLQQAIVKCRQFLEKEKSITSIIVKEKKQLTLCSEMPEINLLLQKERSELDRHNNNNFQKNSEIDSENIIFKYQTITIIKSGKQVHKENKTLINKIEEIETAKEKKSKISR